MIVGVGIDVVDVARFEQTLERTPGLRDRLFTADEAQLPINSLAARFAAKEALAKALGAPAGLHWTDVTVVRTEAGQPFITTQGTVRSRVDAMGVSTLHLSISHDAGIASAVVIAEG